MTSFTMLLHLQTMFQCGNSSDILDESSKGEIDHDNDNTVTDEVPGLEDAQSSSSSSIYVVPSREALEDMVRESQSTRRQGLFDMDRLFICGGREIERNLQREMQPEMEDPFLGDDATTGSFFSRCATKKSSDRALTREVLATKSSTPSHQQHPGKKSTDSRFSNPSNSYRFRICMAPAPHDLVFRPQTSNAKSGDSSNTNLRRTSSDSRGGTLRRHELAELPRLSEPPPPLSRSNSITSE